MEWVQERREGGKPASTDKSCQKIYIRFPLDQGEIETGITDEVKLVGLVVRGLENCLSKLIENEGSWRCEKRGKDVQQPSLKVGEELNQQSAMCAKNLLELSGYKCTVRLFSIVVYFNPHRA